MGQTSVLEGPAPAGGNGAHPRRAASDTTADVGSRKRRREGWGGVWLTVLLFGAVAVVLGPAMVVQAPSSLLLLKIAVAGLFSLIPGWLYLVFIRNKGGSLYDEYVLNLFRLHIDEYSNLPAPPQHTSYYTLWNDEHGKLNTVTTDNLYRRKFETVYGPDAVSTRELIHKDKRRRVTGHRTETFSPVLLATVVLCLGWVLVLEPPGFPGIQLLRDVSVPNRPALPAEALRYGFLGAYTFILQDLARRYFRGDLKTAAFISSAMRIVIVAPLVTALGAAWPSDSATAQLNLLAFVVGFFPQVAFQVIRTWLARGFRKLIPSLEPEYPLSQLDGLNVWYQARLMEEGIEDMQNLVSANLVELLLHSRAPVGRLVDWIDQAALYLHLDPVRDDNPSSRSRLRAMGIRTATDLERAWEAMYGDDTFARKLAEALGVPDEAEARAVVRTIRSSLDGQVNLWHIRRFKGYEWLKRDVDTPGAVAAGV